MLKQGQKASDFALSPTKRNALLAILEKHGLKKSDLRWEVDSSKGGTKTDRLTHEPTGYYFQCEDMAGDPFFDSFGEVEYPWKLTYEPAGSAARFKGQVAWNNIIEHTAVWAKLVKGEYDAPDLWAGHQTEVLDFAAESEDEGQFSEAERAELVQRLEEVKRLLIEQCDAGAETSGRIEKRIEYLTSATERLTKKDWLFMAVSTLSLIAQTVLTSEAATNVWSAVQDRLFSLWDNVPRLIN